MDATPFDPEPGEVLTDAAEAFEPAALRFDPADWPIDAESLRGDLRDALLGFVRSLHKPWAQLTEAQQREVIITAETATCHLVGRALHLLASAEMEHATVILSQAQVKVTKDGRIIEIKAACGYDPETLTFLGGRTAARVLIVGVDSADYLGERAAAMPDPDQPGLPMDAPVADACGAIPPADSADMVSPDGEFVSRVTRGSDEHTRLVAEGWAERVATPEQPKRRRGRTA